MRKTAVYFSFLYKAGLLGCFINGHIIIPFYIMRKKTCLNYYQLNEKFCITDLIVTKCYFCWLDRGHVVNLMHEALPHDFNKAKIALGTESNGDFGMRRDRFCLVIACSEKLRPIA